MSSNFFPKRAGRSRFMRRPLALLLALVLLLALLPKLETATEAAYYDEAIQKLIGWDVLRGYPDGSLQADSYITRAEFVALINRAYGYGDTATIPFNDVPDGAWYRDDISAAYAAGYFTGTSPVTAEPAGELTREQAMVLLARNMRLEEGSGEVTSFSDGRDFHSYSAGYANTAVTKGLVSGYSDGSFRPENSITRGEMAVMLSRALGNLVSSEGTYALGDVFGNVTVNSPNVTLRNTTIAGDLYLTGGLGLGGVTLENVRVLGDIIVAGGGESDQGESVILRNVTADSIRVDTLLGEYVSLRAEGDTNIARALLVTDAYLQDRTASGLGFQTIRMEGEGGEYSLSGNLEKVVNAAPYSMLRVSQGTVKDLTMDEAAVGASLWMDGSATALNLTLDTATSVEGRGDIRKLNVNVAGTTTETLPDNIEIRPGLTGVINGENMDSTAAAEASSEPRLLAGYPRVINVSATSATATFSTNKSGTIYWAVTSISDGSVNEEALLTPAARSSILKSGNLTAAQSNTVYSANITGLTSGGNYYLTAMLRDARGDYSPIKVASFTTTDNSVPAFGSGFPNMSLIEDTYADAAVMATKDCQMYWVVFDKGSAAPTVASFRAGAFSNSYGYGVMDMQRNISATFPVNNLKNLEELKSYDVYFWLNDANSAKSSAVKKLSFTTADRTPPVITTTPYATSIGATNLRLATTVNEAGTFYWVIVESGEDYPKQPNTSIEDMPPGPDKQAAYEEYFKLQIANGMNGLKAGSVRVQPNANATINITGLQAETEYKIYYIAKDNAGNYSEIQIKQLPAAGSAPSGYELTSNFIYQSTLDNHGPTVRQDFTLKLDDTHPLADTNIRIIFSERVQYHDSLNNYYKPLDEAYNEYREIRNGSADQATKDAAAEEFAGLLRKVILLYGSDGELVKERTWDPADPEYAEEDWVIDYRNATVMMEDREMIVTFPTVTDENTERPTGESALNLNSDATYRFSIANVTDTYISPNKIDPNPTRLDTFTTVAAQAVLRSADLSPKEIRLKDGSTMEVDTLFSMTPNSVSRADPTKVWDMLLWAKQDVTIELYMKTVKKTSDTGAPGSDGWEKVGPVAGREDNVTDEIFFTSQTEGMFVGLSFWQDLKGASYNPHIRDDAVTEKQKEEGFFGLEDDLVYYFAIRLNEIESMDRNDYTGSVDIWITVNTADDQDMSSLVQGVLSEGRYNRDFKDKTVSEISTSLTVDEEDRFIRKATFVETAAPGFINGYPKIEVDDTWAKVSLQLERPGTVFYVLAPAEGNDGRLNTTRQYSSKPYREGTDPLPEDFPENGYDAGSTVVFDQYDIPIGDGAYHQSSLVRFYDESGEQLNKDDTGYEYWYPLYLKSPTNRNVFNPGSDITSNANNQTGSVSANNVSIAAIDLSGLEPTRKYFLYLVVVGESGIPSNYAQLYQFETNEANRPDVNVARPQTQLVTVTSTDMDATVDYALFNLNNLGSTILGMKFTDSQVMTAAMRQEFTNTYAGAKDLDGITITDYTVLQAILNRPGTDGSLDSYFDIYANSAFKKSVREFVSSSIATGACIAGGSTNLNQGVTMTIDCQKEYNIDSQNYYFLTVSHYQHISGDDLKNLSEDSYSFRAQSPIYVADNEPPLLRAVNGNIDIDHETGEITGEIYMVFDQPLWYVQDTYTKYPIHQYATDSKDAAGNITYLSSAELKRSSSGIDVKTFTADRYKDTATSEITLTMSKTSGNITFLDSRIAKEYSEVLGTIELNLNLERVTADGLADPAYNYVTYTPVKGSPYQSIWVAGSENNVNIHVTSNEPAVRVVALNTYSLEMTSRTAELTASVTFTSENPESLVTWSSSDSSVVTVSPPSTLDTTSGGRIHNNHKVTLTAQGEGTAMITATCEGVSATCTVTVDASAVPAAFRAAEYQVKVGERLDLKNELNLSSGAMAGASIVWSSNDKNVAQVSVYQEGREEGGVVTGNRKGTAKITAKITPKSGSAVTLTTTVNVTE